MFSTLRFLNLVVLPTSLFILHLHHHRLTIRRRLRVQRPQHSPPHQLCLQHPQRHLPLRLPLHLFRRSWDPMYLVWVWQPASHPRDHPSLGPRLLSCLSVCLWVLGLFTGFVSVSRIEVSCPALLQFLVADQMTRAQQRLRRRCASYGRRLMVPKRCYHPASLLCLMPNGGTPTFWFRRPEAGAQQGPRRHDPRRGRLQAPLACREPALPSRERCRWGGSIELKPTRSAMEKSRIRQHQEMRCRAIGDQLGWRRRGYQNQVCSRRRD